MLAAAERGGNACDSATHDCDRIDDLPRATTLHVGIVIQAMSVMSTSFVDNDDSEDGEP